MSFSGNVKEELARGISKARHCQIAEVAAILCYLGTIEKKGRQIEVRLTTENVILAKKYFELVKRAFLVQPAILIKRNSYLNRSRVYVVTCIQSEEESTILQALKLPMLTDKERLSKEWLVNELLLQKSCCKRAFIRGAFLATGSVTDPEKGYHFEIVCSSDQKAQQLIGQLAFFEIEGKSIHRKGHVVVYIKEGSQIVDALNVMEAHAALMELENVRILKEVRNRVNRNVNCETANINKTVNAAVKQIEDIEYIQSTIGLGELTPALAQMARLRVQYPEAPLKDLGKMLDPPVGKSGVNHRLRKLSEIAEDIKEGRI